MSASGDPSAERLAPDEVARFLRENPDFFERNAELLLELRIPHGGGARPVWLTGSVNSVFEGSVPL